MECEQTQIEQKFSFEDSDDDVQIIDASEPQSLSAKNVHYYQLFVHANVRDFIVVTEVRKKLLEIVDTFLVCWSIESVLFLILNLCFFLWNLCLFDLLFFFILQKDKICKTWFEKPIDTQMFPNYEFRIQPNKMTCFKTVQVRLKILNNSLQKCKFCFNSGKYEEF